MQSPLPDYTVKNIRELLTKLSKKRCAGPFLHPVDYLGLGLLDYPTVITHPMDISTIRSKLTNKLYCDLTQFYQDFKLMISNCHVYNPKDNAVYLMGTELDNAFELEYKKLKDKEVKAKDREAQPDFNKMSDDQQKIKSVLEELLKPKYQHILWPFMDPVSDLIPGYRQVISTPMDMRTIIAKVKANAYGLFGDFLADLKLIVNNCFKFNNDVKKIYDCGMEVKRLYEALVFKEKNKANVMKRVTELKGLILDCDREIRVLEGQRHEDRKFELEERLKIGERVEKLCVSEMGRVAIILMRSGVPIETKEGQVEVDLRNVPDGVFGEILEYLEQVDRSKSLVDK